MFKKNLLYILSIFLLTTSAYSQTLRNTLRIDGQIKENKDKLENVTVTLLSDGEILNKKTTKGSGRFTYEIPLENNYFLVFSKPGYRSKYVEIIATNIPEADANYGFEFGGLDVSLFKNIARLDDNVLNKPVAEIVYDTNLYKFTFNVNYFKEIEESKDSLEQQIALLSKNKKELEELQKQAQINEEEEKKRFEKAQKEALVRLEKKQTAKIKLSEPIEELKTENTDYLVIQENIKLEKELLEQAKRDLIAEQEMIEQELELEREERQRQIEQEAELKKQQQLEQEIEEEKARVKKQELAREKARQEDSLLTVNNKKLVEQEELKAEALAYEEERRIAKEKKIAEQLKKIADEEEKQRKLYEKIQKQKELQAQQLIEAQRKELVQREKILNEQEKDLEALQPGNSSTATNSEKRVFRKGNKTITLYTINKGEVEIELKKVIADWGGQYYFKDNVAITKVDWDLETKDL